MKTNFRVIDTQYGISPHGTTGSYIAGFILSILLTLTPYILVTRHVFSGRELVLVIAGLAMLQLWVQIVFFLHLSRRSKLKWNLMVFVFTIAVVIILAFGSLWIMDNLNENIMNVSPLSLNEGIIPQ